MQRVSAQQISNWTDSVTASNSDEQDQGSFSTLTATRSGAIMVDFRGRTGESTALPYSYLTESRFNPSGEILLRFVGHDVKITGRNLRSLYESLLSHRVTWVRVLEEGSASHDRPEVIGIAIQERA